MKDFPGNIHTSPFESFKKQDKSPPKKSNHPPPKNSIKDNNNINDDANNNNNIKKESDTNKNNNNTIKNNMYILKKTQNMIDPESIPHPSEFEDYYLNTEKQNIYYSTVGNHPPHSISKYSVIETENSSCRLIRSSLVRFPTNQNLLSKTGILFGLYCQPFADFNENEKKNTSSGW